MHKLETLILDNTKITPKAFKYLINLKMLKITNQSNIPDILLSLHNIEYLKLCFQRYSVDQKLYHFTTLKKLKLSGCYDDNFDGSCFKYLINLSELILKNNNVISDDHLIYNKNLEKLSIKYDRKITGSCFSKLPKLRYLDISHCKEIKDKYMMMTQTLESFTYKYVKPTTNYPFDNLIFIQDKLDYYIFKNMNLVQLTIFGANIINQETFYQNIRHMTNLKYIKCIDISNDIITHDYIKSVLPNIKQIILNNKSRVY